MSKNNSKLSSNYDLKEKELINKMMTPEDKKDFKELFEIFAEFDTDGNGSISVEEWKEAMKRFGHEATQEEVHEMMRENNIEIGKDITLFEFIGLINKKKSQMRGQEHAELVKAYRFFDKDLDGVLNAAELKAGLQRAGQTMRLQDLQVLCTMADKDHDGNINFHEFCRIMTLK